MGGARAAWGGHTAPGCVCRARRGAGQAQPQPWARAGMSVFTGWGYSPLPSRGLQPRDTGFSPRSHVWRGRRAGTERGSGRAGPGEGGGRAGPAGCGALGFSLVFPLQLRRNSRFPGTRAHPAVLQPPSCRPGSPGQGSPRHCLMPMGPRQAPSAGSSCQLEIHLGKKKQHLKRLTNNKPGRWPVIEGLQK